MTAVELDPEAEEEIAQAAEWYEERGHAGLGERFVDAVGDAFDEIGERPESFGSLLTERGVVVRRHFVKGFPYHVVFTVRTELVQPVIHVFAVAHLRREPRYWVERVP
jgi:plasmid stabilization system protein ParE